MSVAVLPPFPTGWFCAATSRELPPGGLLSRTLFGRELVLWRTQEGRAVVSDAYCPHLGAHFGHGGCVEANTLRCPFHAFRFDETGKCVATGYGTKPPPKAIVRNHPVRELNGFVMVWFDAEGRAPAWEPPAPDAAGYSEPLVHEFVFRGHPQETTENSVDLGHLSVIHGYERVQALAPLETSGPYLHARYAFERPRGLRGEGDGVRLGAEIEIHVHGLGWSVVETQLPSQGLRLRHFVLSTPIDGEKISLRIGLALGALERPSALHPALALVPRPLARKLVLALAFRGFQADVRQDIPIWEHKKYVHPPALADGDGPVGPYRRWVKQFYQSEGVALPVVAS